MTDNNWGPEFNYELRRKPGHLPWNLSATPCAFGFRNIILTAFATMQQQIANYDFMHWLVQQAKETANMKPFYNIAEHIPETTSITNVDGPMDGCWHDSFYPAFWISAVIRLI